MQRPQRALLALAAVLFPLLSPAVSHTVGTTVARVVAAVPDAVPAARVTAREHTEQAPALDGTAASLSTDLAAQEARAEGEQPPVPPYRAPTAFRSRGPPQV